MAWYWLLMPLMVASVRVEADALGAWHSAEVLHEWHLEGPRTEHLRFSMTGNLLAGAGRDGSWLRVWNLTTGEPIHSLEGHAAQDLDAALPVTDLAFDPRERFLATTSWNPGLIAEASLILWDLSTGDAVQRLAGGQGCHEVAFMPDGDSLWAACGPDAQRYALTDGEILTRREAMPASLTDDAPSTLPAEGLPMPQQGPADALARHEATRRLAWSGQPPTHPSPLVRIWQAPEGGETRSDHSREAYRALPLPDRVETSDPLALTRDLYGLAAPHPVTRETLSQAGQASGAVHITLTLSGLMDDAVETLRYRLDFEPADHSLWRLRWVGRQQRCRRDSHAGWTRQDCP
ncbi:MAG: WD40 repeat domain-containing protein [Halomonas sp.]